MSWYRIAFTEAEVEEGAPGRMEREFRQALMTAHSPNNAAIFSNELAAAGIEYYLSPEVAAIGQAVLTQYDAVSCGRPQADHVRLALGNRATARRLLADGEDV